MGFLKHDITAPRKEDDCYSFGLSETSTVLIVEDIRILLLTKGLTD